jgi:NitT/TauT family transport system substrate-binding protein
MTGRTSLLNVGAPLLAALSFAAAASLPWRATAAAPESPARSVRIGYLPNLTHAQAVAGAQRGDFARALEGVPVEFRTFNAGPALMEALLAGEIDLAYVGPSPAVNAHVKSGGEEVRVVAGAAANGASLVALPGVEDPAKLRVAAPQNGSTQDVAARFFLRDATIVNADNADILTLLLKREIDAAWVPEPWASRLVAEAGGTILFEEKDRWPARRFASTLVVARRAFHEANRDLMKRFLAAHDALTSWLNENPDEAASVVNAGIRRMTGTALPEHVLRAAWGRVVFTTDPLLDTVREQARRAHAVGFLKEPPNLFRLLAGDAR